MRRISCRLTRLTSSFGPRGFFLLAGLLPSATDTRLLRVARASGAMTMMGWP